MTATFELSESEFQNLRSGLASFEEEIWFKNTYDEFLNNPYNFLVSLNIDVMKRFGAKLELVQEFNNDVRKLMPSWKLATVNLRCVTCKISALIILYSLLGSVGVAWDVGLGLINNYVIEMIDKAIGGTGKLVDSFITNLKKLMKRLSISELALEFCRFHGRCQPVEI